MAVTLSAWLDEYLTLRALELAPRTIESYRDQARLHIGPAIGAVPIDALQPSQIAVMLTAICDAGHARTAQICRDLLRSALRAAVEAGAIAQSPAAHVPKPRHRRADARWWSPDELRAFVATSQGTRWTVAWQLALCCGLRRGELAGLRWADLDLQHGVLHVRNQRQRVKGRGVIDGPPKSEAGIRDLSLAPQLVAMLRMAHRCQRPLSAYVMCAANGAGIDPHSLNVALARAIQAAGVRSINLHGLRHTMATLAVALGVPIKVLQGILGHAQYSTTADTYAHIIDPASIAAMDTITAHVLY